MKSVEPGIVQIGAVQDVEGSRLQREVVEDSDIVRLSIRHMDKRRERSSQIEKRMDLDNAFAFAELGPREKRETQVDRGGIEGKDCFIELQADVLGRSLECERAPIIQNRVQVDYCQKLPYLLYSVQDRRLFVFLD